MSDSLPLSMVERVARAIYHVRYSVKHSGFADLNAQLAWDTPPDVRANVFNESNKALAIVEARAAIAAMREPTLAMVRAGEQPGIPFNRQGSDGRAVENRTYSRMIDAALKEPS